METKGNTGGRPRDSFADPHIIVVKEGNGIAKQCKYCHNLFSNKTSITRIKAHLGGVPGQGVAPCKKVPSNVKEDARNAMSSTSKDARNVMSSSNKNSRTDAFLLCSPSVGDIPSNSGTQKPPPHECCTSGSPLPQVMPLVQEKWSWLLDDSLQQSNVDSTCLDVQLDTKEDTRNSGLLTLVVIPPKAAYSHVLQPIKKYDRICGLQYILDIRLNILKGGHIHNCRTEENVR